MAEQKTDNLSDSKDFDIDSMIGKRGIVIQVQKQNDLTLVYLN